jgi:hypothetical protein
MAEFATLFAGLATAYQPRTKDENGFPDASAGLHTLYFGNRLVLGGGLPELPTVAEFLLGRDAPAKI